MIRSELKDFGKHGVEVEFNCEDREQFKLEIAGIITNALKHKNTATALLELVMELKDGEILEVASEDISKQVS